MSGGAAAVMERMCKLYADLKEQSKKVKEIKKSLIEFLHTVPNKCVTVGPYKMSIKEKKQSPYWSKELLQECMEEAFNGELSADEIATRVEAMCEHKKKQGAVIEDLEFKQAQAGPPPPPPQ